MKSWVVWIAVICGACLVLLFPLTKGLLMVSKRAAGSESETAKQLVAIVQAENRYRAAHHGSYARSLGDLDIAFRSTGYMYRYSASVNMASGNIETYEIAAWPRSNRPSAHFFFADQSGVVRWELMRPANRQSPELKSN